MRKYHPLTVVDVHENTADSMSVALAVPEELQEEFQFLPGQHLPMQIQQSDKPVRRTYSICTTPGELPLRIGVRVQPGGVFSEYVANELKAGDTLDVMPPFGQFHARIDSANANTYLGFAAGSGITPILSIVKATLESEPNSRFVLFYGNRRQRTAMFIDELQGLKNKYVERLQLYFLFSQEQQEFDIFSGRMDEAKVAKLYQAFCADLNPDGAFVCGPDTMIESVKIALLGLGMDESSIHSERFGGKRLGGGSRPTANQTSREKLATIDVIMDGHKKSFDAYADSGSIVDAAAAEGIELPYSCKGGVCATCRTFVEKGEVNMKVNYGLEPWEVEKGFVLACQSEPVSDTVTINYDKS